MPIDAVNIDTSRGGPFGSDASVIVSSTNTRGASLGVDENDGGASGDRVAVADAVLLRVADAVNGPDRVTDSVLDTLGDTDGSYDAPALFVVDGVPTSDRVTDGETVCVRLPDRVLDADLDGDAGLDGVDSDVPDPDADSLGDADSVDVRVADVVSVAV